MLVDDWWSSLGFSFDSLWACELLIQSRPELGLKWPGCCQRFCRARFWKGLEDVFLVFESWDAREPIADELIMYVSISLGIHINSIGYSPQPNRSAFAQDHMRARRDFSSWTAGGGCSVSGSGLAYYVVSKHCGGIFRPLWTMVPPPAASAWMQIHVPSPFSQARIRDGWYTRSVGVDFCVLLRLGDQSVASRENTPNPIKSAQMPSRALPGL